MTSAGATGSTVAGATAGNIHQGQLLGGLDRGSSWKFLHRSEGSASTAGATGTIVGSGHTLVVQGGGSYLQHFNLAAGDKLDLTHVLAGAALAHDLTNIGQFVKIVGHGAADPTSGGTRTTLEVAGPAGKARINLVGSGKLDLKDLLQHNSMLLPPH